MKTAAAKLVARELYAKPGAEVALVYTETEKWHVVTVATNGGATVHNHATVIAARMMWESKRAELAAGGYEKATAA